MLTLLGSALGFLTSTGPGIFNKIMDSRQDAKDKAHELAMMAQAGSDRREEALLDGIGQANVEVQKTSQAEINNASTWVVNICALIRPIICIFFLLEYLILTLLAAFGVISEGQFSEIFSPEISAIFGSIISFYFGNRLVSKWTK